MSATALSPAPKLRLRERGRDLPADDDAPSSAPAPAAEPEKADAPGSPTDAPTPGKGRRRFLFIVLGALGLLAGGAWGVRAYLHSRSFQSTDDAFIEAHVIQVSPKVSAHVVAVHFEDNQEVNAGDRLLELDPRDFEIARAQTEANLAAARGRLAQAEAQGTVARAQTEQARAQVASTEAGSENAVADLRRNQELSRQRVIDRRELDASTMQARSSAAGLEAARQQVAAGNAQIALAEAGLQAARGEVAQAEAQVRQAELQLAYTRIAAPAAGRVTRKSVELGNYVQPGQALVAVVAHDVWVVANFKETQLTRMRSGQPVELRVDAFPDRPLRGRVDSVQSGTGARFSLLPPENATGNYVKVVQRVPVKIVLDEPADVLARLAPGMSVEPEVRIQ